MISVKRGDTFAFLAEIKDESGQPLITDVANLRSQIRDTSYQLVCELTVEATETPGTYLFKAPSTEDWPTNVWGKNTLLMDIELNVEGQVNSSETVKIEVIKDVTFDE